MIVLFHEATQIVRIDPNLSGTYFNWLPAGVDIFFVISGFVMRLTTQDARVTPGQFMRHRIARIVPLYWIVTGTMVVLLIVAPKLLQSARFDLPLILSSFFFVPWPNPGVGDELKPLLIVGWTLNYEMFFYVVFALCLFVSRRYQLWLLAAVLGGLALAGQLSLISNKWLAFYADHHALEFLAGVIIAALTRAEPDQRGKYVWPVVGLLALAGFAPSLALQPFGLQGAAWTFLSSLFVLSLVCWPASAGRSRRALLPRVAGTLGDASYSIYLTHPLVLSAVGQAFQRTGLGHAPHVEAVFIAVATSAAVGIGLLVHHMLEVPLVRIAKRTARLTTKLPAPAPAIAAAPTTHTR